MRETSAVRFDGGRRALAPLAIAAILAYVGLTRPDRARARAPEHVAAAPKAIASSSCQSGTYVAERSDDSSTRAYSGSEVTRPISPIIRVERSEPPARELLTLGQPQRAIVHFVVDTMGVVEPCSVRLVETTHPLWGEAVMREAPTKRYHPALRGTRKVREVVNMTFGFSVQRER